MATSISHLLDVQEQICYVQCTFCTTMLLVSVPYSSMSMVVTVRCGHCTGLLSVNMLKASFVPLHLFSSLDQDQLKQQEQEDASSRVVVADKHNNNTMSPMVAVSDEDNSTDDDNEDEGGMALDQIVNKPPEKKTRAPSAYNRFIKEEIKRLKARNPTMNHKEAFSTAAKNWAHFPSVQHDEVDDEDISSGDDEISNAT
ncbi:axial regulator YABBY 4 [Silene latifolia]|uniref:axial regulator YABBY 4 n=1 Tax=Silene latifolia TaxID=37657 RepID=UPI003D77646B